MKDNLIDKNIKNIRDDLAFIRRRNINPFMSDLINVYAAFFENGNKDKAKEKLDGAQNTMSVPDLLQISFFTGAIVICLVIMLFFMVF